MNPLVLVATTKHRSAAVLIVVFRSAKGTFGRLSIATFAERKATIAETMVKVFAVAKSGSATIFAYVVSQIFVLIGASNQMVKGLLLPELTFRVSVSIDLSGGVVQPRIALPSEHFFGREACQQVNMIGHDDEVAQSISVAIKMHESVGHNFR